MVERATCSKALLRKHGFKSHVARFTSPFKSVIEQVTVP